MGILSKWVESLDYEYEILHSCIRHRSPRSTCEECVKSCPENAISIYNSKPQIDNKKCTECGQCISVCPVQAVAGIYPNRTIKQGQLVSNRQRTYSNCKGIAHPLRKRNSFYCI